MKWKELTKIGISGSRKYPSLALCGIWLERYIDKQFESSEQVVVVHGGALGVDSIVESTCNRRGIKTLCIPARWLELEKVAGPHRNQHIIDLCNEFYAFWDGKSPGTKNAIKLAEQAGKLVKVFSPDDLRRLVKIRKEVVEEPKKYRLPAKTKKRSAIKTKAYMDAARDFFGDMDK